MKKIFTLLALTFLATYSFAQITITSADMPSVNDTFRLSLTTNDQGIDATTTGANYTWDFSILVPDSQRVDTIVPVGSTPFAYQFYFNNPFLYPGYDASYAKKGPEFDLSQIPLPVPVTVEEIFNYTKNSSAGLHNVGFGANINGVPASVQNIPLDVEYQFPLNYTNGIDSVVSSSEFELTVPTLGHYGQTMDRITSVDGWGSLVLPNGTYNVLRVKSILYKVDTVYTSNPIPFGTTFPRPEEVEYKWLGAGTGEPLLKVVTNAGIVSQIEYQDDYVAPIGISEITELSNVMMFPNPAKNLLVIDYVSRVAGDLRVDLKDLLGKEVENIYKKHSAKGTNKIVLNLMDYNVNPGIYFLELNVNGNIHHTEKLIVY